MKYLYSWLKEYYPSIPSLEDLSAELIQLGHDIESIDPITYDGVIIAEITDIQPHPNAERLRLATITTGSETLTVVCGAPNLELGQKVAYATIGTELPCGLVLKEATIRGEVSRGMLCAPDELGLGDSHEGLLPIPSDAVLGEPLQNYVPMDAIISLDITRNRGDVLSHFGLARDLHALHSNEVLPLNLDTTDLPEAGETPVTIESFHDDVNVISFGLVECESLGHTPLLLQSRLHLLGHKVINLPTDITNYILLGYGQPMHAYDADTLSNPIVLGARRAQDKESFNALNGKTYTLSPQAIVIHTPEAPATLVGIIGGEHSKVTSKTTRVLFEAAHFNPKAVSITSRGLGLTTEGSTRWERGVDETLYPRMMREAQRLLLSATKGSAYRPVTLINNEYTSPEPITLSHERITTVLGSHVEVEQVINIFNGLGIHVTTDNEIYTVTPPSWRHDLSIAEDYIEEVARYVGLHTLPKKPLLASVPQWRRSKWWRYEHVKDMLTRLGGSEIMTYPFVSIEEQKLFWPDASETTLPELVMSALEGKQFIRATLGPAMMQTVAANPEEPFLILYEINKTYATPEEPIHLCISVSGNDPATVDGWWQHFFERMKLPLSSWMTRVSTVSDDIKDKYKIRKSYVTLFELPIDSLPLMQTYDMLPVDMPELDTIHYAPVSKYQASRRDIAVIVDDSHDPDAIVREIVELDPRITDVSIFDLFRNPDKIGENKQSIGLRVTYQADDHTLTTDEINELHTSVETYMKEHYHGIIR